MFDKMDINLQIAIITAGAGLIGSIIGAVSTLLAVIITKKLQEQGLVTLHVKLVHTKDAIHNPWGYYKSQSKAGLYLQVPLWLDVCNTSGVPRVLRNVNLYAYNNKNEVAAFTQIQSIGRQDNLVKLGDNESYTLVIPANSARRFDLCFMLHEQELPKDGRHFDELILTYYDEKNVIRAYKFVEVEKCWVEGALPPIKNWITLSKKCKYAK